MTAIHLVGGKELRRELRRLGGESPWSKELTKVHKKVAHFVAPKAQSEARSMGGVQAHFASHIKPRATVMGARIGLQGSRPVSAAAFWGAKKRTGWYAADKYAGSEGRQHPPWVGASWKVGAFGEGPYAINQAIFANRVGIEDLYAKGLDDLLQRAFPEAG